MFTKRSWESFYSGLVMVGLVFMVFPVIYFCGATKEKQILPPLIMFLLGLVIFRILGQSHGMGAFHRMFYILSAVPINLHFHFVTIQNTILNSTFNFYILLLYLS